MTVYEQIAQTAAGYGVDPGIALAVAQRESGFRQNARGQSGEVGVFQLMPATASSLNVDPTDLGQNIQGGCMYLAEMYSQFGNWQDALAAYNWGPGRVSAALANGTGYPASVQSYVGGVLSQAASFNYGVLPASSGTTSSSIANSLASLVPTTPQGVMVATAAGAIALWLLLD